ncbi:MAG: nucleotidyltransferase family protein [Thermoanaerobaculia bacterium]
MPAPLRFRPPRLAIPPTVRWMLLRAFGPPGAIFPGELPAVNSLILTCRDFEMASRIMARQRRERLTAELGEEAAASFAKFRLIDLGSGMRLMETAREAARAASAHRIPLALLKFAALEATGLLPSGGRGACDVDLLAPADRAEELWELLRTLRFRGAGRRRLEHQFPPLLSPHAGGVVEVHRHLPGVRVAGRASADFAALERQGLLRPLADFPDGVLAPIPEVLAAHVLVHGLAQHGYWPRSYPLLKMVADLSDLRALSGRAIAWTSRDVSAGEAGAVRRLVERLAAGEDPLGWEGPEEVLLRHIVAGQLDAGYARSLKLGLFRPQPSDFPRPVQLARTLLGSVFLDREQIDAIYGRPTHPLGYVGRRLARPFDLLGRLGAYGWARLRR